MRTLEELQKANMDKAARREVARTLRVSAGLLQGAHDGALLAVLKKVAKKTKMGEYDPVEVVEALKLLDPAWSIDAVTIAVPMGGYGDLSDIGDDMLAKIADDPTVFVRGGMGKDKPFTLSFRGDSHKHGTPETLEPLAEKLRGQITLVPGKKAPKAITKPEAGKLYAWKVEVSEDSYVGREGPTWDVLVHGLMLGLDAWHIVAPGGVSLDLPVMPTRRDPKPRILKSPTLFTWLYKSTDAAAKAAERISTPAFLEQETKNKARRLAGDKPGSIGSCPFCERHQKLNPKRAHSGHPTMVLHGYQRPGYGYAVGKCFGVGYPPYELSAAGCEAAVTALEKMITNQKANLAAATKATEFTRFVTISPFRGGIGHDATFRMMKLGLDGTMSPVDDKVLDRTQMRKVEQMGPRAIVLQGTDAKGVDPKDVKEAAAKVHADLVANAEHILTNMEDDLARMQAKVKNWKLQPLPGMETEE